MRRPSQWRFKYEASSKLIKLHSFDQKLLGELDPWNPALWNHKLCVTCEEIDTLIKTLEKSQSLTAKILLKKLKARLNRYNNEEIFYLDLEEDPSKITDPPKTPMSDEGYGFLVPLDNPSSKNPYLL